MLLSLDSRLFVLESGGMFSRLSRLLILDSSIAVRASTVEPILDSRLSIRCSAGRLAVLCDTYASTCCSLDSIVDAVRYSCGTQTLLSRLLSSGEHTSALQ